MFKILILSLSLLIGINGLHLPNYIKPCKKSDILKCATEHARQSIPAVIKGDKKYKIFPLSPLFLEKLSVDAGSNLKLNLKNTKVYGLETAYLNSSKFDLDKQTSKMTFHFNVLNIQGEYDINGKILILPITGEGKTNLTFEDAIIQYDYNWDIVKKKGVDYMSFKETELTLTPNNMLLYFENLFGGDKALGENMNKVLNENWREVLKEIGNGINHTLQAIADRVFKAYFENIPYNEIFID